MGACYDLVVTRLSPASWVTFQVCWPLEGNFDYAWPQYYDMRPAEIEKREKITSKVDILVEFHKVIGCSIGMERWGGSAERELHMKKILLLAQFHFPQMGEEEVGRKPRRRRDDSQPKTRHRFSARLRKIHNDKIHSNALKGYAVR
jgi:hypothetical protein